MFYTAYMVIYLDIIFLNHYLINRIMAVWMKALFPYYGKRIWWEVGIVLMALLQMPQELLHIQNKWAWYLVVPDLLGLGAWLFCIYKVRSVKKAIRMLLVYWMGTMLMGGVFFAMLQCEAGCSVIKMCRQHIGIFDMTMLAVAMVSEGLLCLAKKQSEFARMQVKVTLYGNGREVCLSGYMDTGNLLCDPHTGRPVVTAHFQAVAACLNREQISNVLACLSGYEMEKIPEGLSLIECSGVTAANRKMPVWISDKMIWKTDQGIKVHENQPVMLCEQKLMSGECDVLLNGHMMEI